VVDDLWSRHAAAWDRIGPPLRPSPDDGAILERLASSVAAPRVLVLGTTPEMARLAWPAGTTLLAVDRSPTMIADVWPGFPRPGEGALLADWRTMALPPASRDLVVGDGITAVLRWPDELAEVCGRVRDVLAPGGPGRPAGRVALRAFLRPDVPEAPEAVLDAALARRIAGFHAFKLRLVMALQADPARGVAVADVWRWWAAHGPGADALAAATGWPAGQIDTLGSYRDATVVMTFPTADELRAVAAAAGLVEVATEVGGYELAERTPTVVWAREG
jgi:SAM-dependent methyltransferase